MAALALALFVLYAALAFGLRTFIQLGRSGSSGFKGVSGRPGSAGPFAVVRNPIFSAMFAASLGLVLLVPNVAALLGHAALVTAVELQVRFVEEPYLVRTHGGRYREYASRVGRFAPGAGRLRP